ncbi:glycosyltransferase family 2 protein [soil metagenome]
MTNIVIPMAGRGKRFADVGHRVPKPLIPVFGKPMYSWAVDGLPLDPKTRLIFVCLKEHLDGSDLVQDIQTRYVAYDPAVIALDKVTDGQACTVLMAREYINSAEELVIYNADTHYKTTIRQALTTRLKTADGVLDVFKAEGDHWSFARTDASGRVVECAEKKRISEWATTGLYYFRTGSDFVKHAEAMIAADERTKGEFYVVPIYNRMIAAGCEIRINLVNDVWVLGTPEELAAFERAHQEFLK